MKYSILPEADGEAIAAVLWYENQRIGLGDEFLAELHAGFELICAAPRLMPRLESYKGVHNIRWHLLRRFPYVVIVNCRDDELLIVAIAHSRRHPLYWMDRLN